MDARGRDGGERTGSRGIIVEVVDVGMVRRGGAVPISEIDMGVAVPLGTLLRFSFPSARWARLRVSRALLPRRGPSAALDHTDPVGFRVLATRTWSRLMRSMVILALRLSSLVSISIASAASLADRAIFLDERSQGRVSDVAERVTMGLYHADDGT